MAHLINVENKVANVLVDKDFNFKTHKSFTNAIKESLEQGSKVIVLEFKEVEYMDSTALGLLMVAKDNAESVDCEIKLQNVTGYARKIIEMSQFDKKFEILG